MKRVFIYLFIISYSLGKGQNTFHTLYGHNTGAHDIKQMPDGGYITSGKIRIDSSGSLNFFAQYISRLDKNGNVKWTKMYDTTSAKGSAAFCTFILNPNEYLVFSELSDSLAHYGSILAFKIDSSGNVKWSKQIDSSYYIQDLHFCIRNNNSYYVAGTRSDSIGAKEDLFVIETDSNLNVKWGKYYDFPSTLIYDDDFILTDIAISGNKLILASYGYRVNGNTDGNQGEILVLDSMGNIISSKLSYIPPPGSGIPVCYLYSVLPFSPNEIYFFGAYSQNSFNVPPLMPIVFKTDSNLNLTWAKMYHSGIQQGNIINAIKTNDGNIVFNADYSKSTGIRGLSFTKMDTSGNIIWSKLMNDTAIHTGSYNINQFIVFDVLQTADSGFALIGEANHIASYQWIKTQIIKTDAFGNQPCNYGTINYTYSNDPFYLVNYTPNTLGLTNLVVSSSILTTKNIMLNEVDFCTFNSIERYSSNFLEVRLFPNPTSAKINLESSQELCTISIYNYLGETVLQTKSKSKEEQIDVSQLAPGVYIIQSKDWRGKFIKQ